MARLFGIEMPQEKQVRVGLTYLFGIGDPLAKKILIEAGIDSEIRVKTLTEIDLAKLREVIEKHHYLLEGELRRVVAQNIRRLKDIGSYRGWRHKKNLPVHGQRTRTNARTKRGKKITVGGSGGKKALQKT